MTSNWPHSIWHPSSFVHIPDIYIYISYTTTPVLDFRVFGSTISCSLAYIPPWFQCSLQVWLNSVQNVRGWVALWKNIYNIGNFATKCTERPKLTATNLTWKVPTIILYITPRVPNFRLFHLRLSVLEIFDILGFPIDFNFKFLIFHTSPRHVIAGVSPLTEYLSWSLAGIDENYRWSGIWNFQPHMVVLRYILKPHKI